MYEYEYMISIVADKEIYYKQCAALEIQIPGLQKLRELHDVDGGIYQYYQYEGKNICVLYDRYLNDVHIKSEIPLELYLEKE